MALTRRIARPLLASVFIAGGVEAIRDPEGKAKAAQAVTVPLTRQFPSLPGRSGAAGPGQRRGAGRWWGHSSPPVASAGSLSVALIASIIPTTYAGHRFWEEEDDASRAEQRAHFLKNLGLLGGLILAAADTEGEPSLGWRALHRAARNRAAVAVGRTAGSSSARKSRNSVADGVTVFARQARVRRRRGAQGPSRPRRLPRSSRQVQDAAALGAQRADLTAHHLADTLPGVGQQLAGESRRGRSAGRTRRSPSRPLRNPRLAPHATLARTAPASSSRVPSVSSSAEVTVTPQRPPGVPTLRTQVPPHRRRDPARRAPDRFRERCAITSRILWIPGADGNVQPGGPARTGAGRRRFGRWG